MTPGRAHEDAPDRDEGLGQPGTGPCPDCSDSAPATAVPRPITVNIDPAVIQFPDPEKLEWVFRDLIADAFPKPHVPLVRPMGPVVLADVPGLPSWPAGYCQDCGAELVRKGWWRWRRVVGCVNARCRSWALRGRPTEG